MRLKHQNKQDGLFKSIVLAYTILISHVLLLAGLGLLVIFFRGVAQYMLWIFLGGLLLIAGSGWLWYRRLRKQGKSLAEALRSPVFQGREVEVRLLGGLATVRLGKPNQPPALQVDGKQPPAQLEDPETMRLREISALAQLLEKELITPEEFAKAKQQMLGM